MDSYNRLLELLKSDSPKAKDLVEELKILICPSEDIKKSIEKDISILIPRILILSCSSNKSIRESFVPVFETLKCAVNRQPSEKFEPWWKSLETDIVPNQFCTKMLKLLTRNESDWVECWTFAANLMISEVQVNGLAINSLLKIVETAFKMSKKNIEMVKQAFTCWMKLIEIFSLHSRVMHSKKLVGLLVKPLATNLQPKASILKIKTWNLLVEKIGVLHEDCAETIVNPFIDYMFCKGKESMATAHPENCYNSLIALLHQKTIRKRYSMKIVNSFNDYIECGLDLNVIAKLFDEIVEMLNTLEKQEYETHVLELLKQVQKWFKSNDYPSINQTLLLKFYPLVTLEYLNTWIIEECIAEKMLISLMTIEEFRINIFNPLVVNFVKTNTNSKQINNKAKSRIMGVWDTYCKTVVAWLSLQKIKKLTEVEEDTLYLLLCFPLDSELWYNTVRNTWTLLCGELPKLSLEHNMYKKLVMFVQEQLNNSKLTASLTLGIVSLLGNSDKNAFKEVVQLLEITLEKLPNDFKQMMEFLLIIDAIIIFNQDKKQDIFKLLSSANTIIGTFEQVQYQKLHSKAVKLHRKLMTLAESHDDKKQSPKITSPETTSQNKIVSPFSQSNFLQRLAKAEEKKRPKSPISNHLFSNEKTNVSGSKAEDDTISEDSTKINNHAEESPPTNVLQESQMGKAESPITTNCSVDKIVVEKQTIEKENDAEVVPFSISSNPIIITPNKIKIRTQSPALKTNSTTPSPSLRKSPKVKAGMMNLTPKKLTPSKCTYFDDDASDFVLVTTKPKPTILTEHQKEIMCNRSTDIPALYQDLSQDTQTSNSCLKKFECQGQKLTETVTKVDEPTQAETSTESIIQTTPVKGQSIETPDKFSLSSAKKLDFNSIDSPVTNSPLIVEPFPVSENSSPSLENREYSLRVTDEMMQLNKNKEKLMDKTCITTENDSSNVEREKKTNKKDEGSKPDKVENEPTRKKAKANKEEKENDGEGNINSEIGTKKKNKRKSNPIKTSPKFLRSKRFSLDSSIKSPKVNIKAHKLNRSVVFGDDSIESQDSLQLLQLKYSKQNTKKEDDPQSNDESDSVKDEKVNSKLTKGEKNGKKCKTGKRKRKQDNNSPVQVKKIKIEPDTPVPSIISSKKKNRAKKILKLNGPGSPTNNLEQWLLKSGKVIITTPKQTLDSSESDQSLVIKDSNDLKQPQIKVLKTKVLPQTKEPEAKCSPESKVKKTKTKNLHKTKEPAAINMFEIKESEKETNQHETVNMSEIKESEKETNKHETINMSEIKESEKETNTNIKTETNDLVEIKDKQQDEDFGDRPKDKTERMAEPQEDPEKFDKAELELAYKLLLIENESINSSGKDPPKEIEEFTPAEKSSLTMRRGVRLLSSVLEDDETAKLYLVGTVDPARRKSANQTPNSVSPLTSGRSAQMMRLAKESVSSQKLTPTKRRSIVPQTFGENWPKGITEDWIACIPTPPGRSPGRGVLKMKMSSLPSSPIVSHDIQEESMEIVNNGRKKRVSFLDPPVSRGLIYDRITNLGAIHLADIPPGETPVWKGDSEHMINVSIGENQQEVEEMPLPSGGGIEDLLNNTSLIVEISDEDMTDISETSTTILEPEHYKLDQLRYLENCNRPIADVFRDIPECCPILNRLRKLEINQVWELKSLDLSIINSLPLEKPQEKTLYSIVKKYLKTIEAEKIDCSESVLEDKFNEGDESSEIVKEVKPVKSTEDFSVQVGCNTSSKSTETAFEVCNESVQTDPEETKANNLHLEILDRHQWTVDDVKHLMTNQSFCRSFTNLFDYNFIRDMILLKESSNNQSK